MTKKLIEEVEGIATDLEGIVGDIQDGVAAWQDAEDKEGRLEAAEQVLEALRELAILDSTASKLRVRVEAVYG